MAILSFNPFFRQRGPLARLATPLPKRLPVWPTVSIVLLLMVAALFTPLILTVLNTMLVFLALLYLLISRDSLDVRALWVVGPFFVIVLLGMATGVGANSYDYFKDIWYVLNPVLVMATGYVLFRGKPHVAFGLRAFVFAGLVVAVWQIRPYFFYPEIIFLNTETIRKSIGTGFYAPVVALLILLITAGRWRQLLRLPTWLGVLLFILIAISVSLMFSRTAFLVGLVGIAAWAGAFAKREWLRLFLPLMVVGYGAFMLQYVIDVDSAWATRTFTGKLARAVSELTVADHTGMHAIGMNFRGYETAQALRQFENSSVLQMLFGQGFGAKVDLGVSLPLEANEAGQRINVRFIGVLHNGYTYLLTKSGAVSVVAYLFALGYLYMLARPFAAQSSTSLARPVGRLLQALVVTLVVTTYVVGGVFNKLDMFPLLLLIGYLFAYFRQPES